MEQLDWGEGNYARTAEAIAPASEALVEFARIEAGQAVLDVACGTGNAAIAAAERGATVTGVDPAEVLIEQAAARAAERGIDARWIRGGADELPVADGAFDVAMSVFGVIFAPDPGAAAAEMVRAVRPGGTVALTSWRPSGPISAVGGIMFRALPSADGPPRDWGDPGWTTATLEAAGAKDVRIEETELAFTAASPQAWLDEQCANHPVWRWARRQLGEEKWREVEAESVAALTEGNEDPDAFRTNSRYLLV
ncbi:MAG TPA: class I SAM-dependent methyltransferase, partial [Thermoleophilaceae bacterium]|nr:class I SAM-dependent methyltransferase [Thermoleophilaceae bacterium]